MSPNLWRDGFAKTQFLVDVFTLKVLNISFHWYLASTVSVKKMSSYPNDDPLCMTSYYSLDALNILSFAFAFDSLIKIWNRSQAQVGCMRQVLAAGALGRPRGIRWRGRWEGGSGWQTHINPWLIHVNVWQKPLQYCKVISLQLIKINGKKYALQWVCLVSFLLEFV